MRRRTALATISTLGTALLAGCSLDREPVHGPADTATGPTETIESTDVATATSPASTPRPGDVPSDRVVTGEAVSGADLGVTANRWFGLEDVRYTTDGDEYQTVSADRGWFVAYEFTLRNHGSSRADSLPDSVFEIRVDGETYEHIHELPGGVQFSAIDQPDSEPRIRDLAWYGGLDPGESVSLQLVFDAPVRRAFRHYLVGDHEPPVEGTSDPVYLTGRRELVDDR